MRVIRTADDRYNDIIDAMRLYCNTESRRFGAKLLELQMIVTTI